MVFNMMRTMILKKLFFFAKKKFNYFFARRRKIIKIEEFTKNKNKIIIFNSEQKDAGKISFYPENVNINLNSNFSNNFPPVYMVEISDVKIYGKTNILFNKEYALCHDMYNFKEDLTSEELHGLHLIDLKNNKLIKLNENRFSKKINCAAAFSDALSSNYAHWLSEIYPRIVLFCSMEKYKNIPIIIDKDVHPNIINSVLMVSGNREIIYIEKNESIHLNKCIYVSPVGYIPFEPRTIGSRQGHFSSSALYFTKLKILNNLIKCNESLLPKKIFIKRNSFYRNLINQDIIENFLVKNGFFIMEPEKFDFEKQVIIFNNADIIIGPTGAAMANLIFSKPDAKIGIIIAEDNDIPYYYWHNMANAVGNKINYLLGVKLKNTGVHSDYFLDLSILKDWLIKIYEK